MKLFEKLTKKVTKTASETVKKEVKKKALDLLPIGIGLGGAAVGLLIFKKTGVIDDSNEELPQYRTINITTNNYYFGKSDKEGK